MYNAEMIAQAWQEHNQSGEELPPYVTDAPILRFGLALYYNAWFELDTERRRVRLEPIKRSSVFEYGRDYELSDVQIEDLWFYVSRMDSGFLDWYSTVIGNQNGNVDRPSS